MVAGAGAGLPGEVSASSGLGTDVTVHLRCLGEANVTLTVDDASIHDDPDPVVCDGQQHDLDLSLDADATTLAILPETDGAGGATAWVVAVTTS